MAEKMTEKVARLKLVADGLRRIQEFESARYLDEYAAHLAQPAQAVDVGAIREVIAELYCAPYRTAREQADKLTRAIGNAHLAGMGEPVAIMYQHDETGRTTIIDMQQVEWGWEKNNLGWTRVQSLFAKPPAPIDLVAVCEVIDSHVEEAKKLTHDPESRDYLHEQADKLEAALAGGGK